MDVLASGYPSLDYIIPVSHSPTIGSTAIIMQQIPDEITPTVGGCGANVAVGLSRLGFSTGVAAVIGDDQRGRYYRESLAAEKVDIRNLIVLPGENTSLSYLFRNPQGEYQNFFSPGAADEWSGELHLVGLDGLRYGLITVGQYEHNLHFLKQMLTRNIPVAWQLKPDIFAYPSASVEEFARQSEIILMNRFEADFVKRALGLNSVVDLLSEKTRLVVVTQGAKGVEVFTQEHCYILSAVPVQVVDTVGAGDGFTVGFLAGMLQGQDPIECARLGVIVASFVIEAIGCQTNLPTWDQIYERGQKHKPMVLVEDPRQRSI